MKNFSSYYYIDEDMIRNSKEEVIKPDYKCSRNFQRMLKIKDKIRKKNVQAVSKDKQQQYRTLHVIHPQSQRELSSGELSAKATLERNKLKIKMRGLSK